MVVERPGRPAHALGWSGHTLGAGAALVVLISILLQRQVYWSKWPLWIMAVLLGVGMVTEQVAGSQVMRGSVRDELARRYAQPVAAIAAILIAIWDLSHASSSWRPSLLWVVVAVLGLGLSAAPVAQLTAGLPARGWAQPIAALTGLFVLTLGLAVVMWPAWPMGALRAAAVFLSVGFVAGQLARDQAVRRLAQPTAAVASLFLLIVGLSDTLYVRPMWPLWTFAGLLGLGLIAAQVGQLGNATPLRDAALPIAATTTLLVLVVGLSVDRWLLLPMGTLRAVAVLLGLGLIAGHIDGDAPIRRLAQPVAAVASLYLLARGLSDTPGITPVWLLWTMVALLVAGLAAGPLGRFAGSPRERILSERVDQLSRTRSGALDVQATELRRIERDLHDGAQVRLVALSMKLGRAEDRYRDDPETAALLREAREDAAAAIRELRELARGIAPPVLTDRGLEAAVRSLAQRSGSDATVYSELTGRPQPAVENAAYFVVAESLTNAAKHATGSRVEVRLDQRGGDLFIDITDFGPGGADRAGGGLTGLRQRVEALDGTFHVTSPLGVGTQVEAVLPCAR